MLQDKLRIKVAKTFSTNDNDIIVKVTKNWARFANSAHGYSLEIHEYHQYGVEWGFVICLWMFWIFWLRFSARIFPIRRIRRKSHLISTWNDHQVHGTVLSQQILTILIKPSSISSFSIMFWFRTFDDRCPLAQNFKFYKILKK